MSEDNRLIPWSMRVYGLEDVCRSCRLLVATCIFKYESELENRWSV